MFKDLQSDKEFPQDLETKGLFKFARYDMHIGTEDSDFDQTAARQSALDFITGLRQFREDQKKKQDERMTHSEEEVMQAFVEDFEAKMKIVHPSAIQMKEQTPEEEVL